MNDAGVTLCLPVLRQINHMIRTVRVVPDAGAVHRMFKAIDHMLVDVMPCRVNRAIVFERRNLHVVMHGIGVSEDVLDVHTVDLAHPLPDQLGGILRPGNCDCFPAGAEDFHHQLDDLIHPIPVIRRDKAVIPDLRPHAVPNRRSIFLPFPEMD